VGRSHVRVEGTRHADRHLGEFRANSGEFRGHQGNPGREFRDYPRNYPELSNSGVRPAASEWTTARSLPRW